MSGVSNARCPISSWKSSGFVTVDTSVFTLGAFCKDIKRVSNPIQLAPLVSGFPNFTEIA